METVIFKDSLVGAAELIRQGELVAVPTETVYGLAGNALDEKADQQTLDEIRERARK